MHVQLTQLRYLVKAADHGSFRRAAAALNITQPTLSKRIRELKEELGVLLFTRSTGGAELTPLGEDVTDVARRVLAELDGMETRAKAGKQGDVGRLEIGFYTSLSTGLLRESILSFAAQHPAVEINLIESARSSLVSRLDRRAIDIIIVLGEPCHGDFAHAGFWSDRIMVALPKDHALAERDYVYWTDIKDERFLVSRRDPGPEIQDILISKLTSPGSRPLIKWINANRETVLSMVDGKRGITLICESATGNGLPSIVFREVRDGNGPTRIG